MSLTLPQRQVGRLFPAYLRTDLDGRVVAAGPAILRICGEDLVGQPVLDRFCDPSSPGAVFKTWARSCDHIVLAALGEVALRLHGAVVDAPDGFWFLMGIAPDLQQSFTEARLRYADFSPFDGMPEAYGSALIGRGLLADAQELAERLQTESHRALAANAAKSIFLANMSHEIRTPLNGAIGFLSLLAATPLSPQQAEMVAVVQDSAQDLARLLGDILDYACLERGEGRLDRAPFALGEAVRSVADHCGRQASDKGLELHVRVDPDAEIGVVGDALRLKQVLKHLVGNAVRFTDHGRVELAVRREEEGDRFRFSITDTGVGFGPEEAQRIFAAFEQGCGELSRPQNGAGLGLALCKELVALMGGELTADSDPGKGAVFSFTVAMPEVSPPIRVAGEAEAESGRGDGQSSDGPLRVLLADDHPVNRRLVQVVLSQLGAEVVAVENGEQATLAFGMQSFDLVLMDMQMPVMDGLCATRILRRLERERRQAPTPILMLSANVLPEHVAAALHAGADRHVSKPIAPDALIAAVLDAVCGHEPEPVACIA